MFMLLVHLQDLSYNLFFVNHYESARTQNFMKKKKYSWHNMKQLIKSYCDIYNVCQNSRIICKKLYDKLKFLSIFADN